MGTCPKRILQPGSVPTIFTHDNKIVCVRQTSERRQEQAEVSIFTSFEALKLKAHQMRVLCHLRFIIEEIHLSRFFQ